MTRFAPLKSETKTGRNGKEYTRFRMPNEDIYSLVNTIEKMACKRALVHAVIGATRSSALFTQDVEDLSTAAGGANPEPAREPATNGKPAEQEPEITRKSQVSWGKLKGKAIDELPDAYLAWAVEPGRKFGADTARWQAAMRAEIVRRETAGDDDIDENELAGEPTADDLPFEDAPK